MAQCLISAGWKKGLYERLKDKQTDKQTDRLSDKHTGGPTYRRTNGQMDTWPGLEKVLFYSPFASENFIWRVNLQT